MFGKFFISFFILGLVAVKASHVSSVEVVDIEESITIRKIIESIKNATSILSHTIQLIIQKITDKIIKILGGQDSGSEITQKIIDDIKPILGQVGEKVNKCIEDNMPEIQEIAQNQQEETMKCSANAFAAEAIEIGKHVLKHAAFCAVSGDIKNCLDEKFQKTIASGKALIEKAMGLISHAQNIMMEVSMCSQKVQDETTARIKVVYKKIATCVTTYEDMMIHNAILSY